VPPADLKVEQAVELLETKQRGPREIGADPETGLMITVANGRFGPYVQLGETPPPAKKAKKGAKAAKVEKPRRASLAKDMTEESVTLEQALKLLSLPREIGVHPESAEPILAAVSRFGPFVRCGTKYRSLEEGDDIYTVALERAVELLAQPPKRRSSTRTVVKEFGKHPDTAKEVQLLEGRYGPYLTDGNLNASLPQGTVVADMDLESALDLLARRGKEPKRKRARKAS
jgi:DNA topoisomerase-1